MIISRTWFGLIGAFLLTLAAIVFAMIAAQRTEKIKKLEHAFPTMGTKAVFTIWAKPSVAETAARQARAEFDQVIQICNLYNPESELSRLNRSAWQNEFVCSDELWALLYEARRAYVFSNGAFDITAKPLMDLWGFYRKRGNLPPSQEEIAETQKKVGLDKVHFDDEKQTVKFTIEGMAFDLGGIAKGYAVDRATEVMLKAGVKRGVIDLGGNLRLLPEPPPGKPFYRIGIRNPENRNKNLPQTLELLNTAVSTSGNYERYVTIDGKRYGHIINPKTGQPTQANYSVTVIAPAAMLADWLSTSIFLSGTELGNRAEKTFPGVQVIFSKPTFAH